MRVFPFRMTVRHGHGHTAVVSSEEKCHAHQSESQCVGASHAGNSPFGVRRRVVIVIREAVY